MKFIVKEKPVLNSIKQTEEQKRCRKKWNIARNAILIVSIIFGLLLIGFAIHYINDVLNPPQEEIVAVMRKFASTNSDYILDSLVAEKYVVWNKSRTFFAILSHLMSLGSIIFSLVTIFIASVKNEKKTWIIICSMLAMMFTVCNIYFRFDTLTKETQNAWRDFEATIIETVDKDISSIEKTRILREKIIKTEIRLAPFEP